MVLLAVKKGEGFNAIHGTRTVKDFPGTRAPEIKGQIDCQVRHPSLHATEN